MVRLLVALLLAGCGARSLPRAVIDAGSQEGEAEAESEAEAEAEAEAESEGEAEGQDPCVEACLDAVRHVLECCGMEVPGEDELMKLVTSCCDSGKCTIGLCSLGVGASCDVIREQFGC